MNSFLKTLSRIGEKVLKWFSSDHEIESTIGDIEEVHSELVTSKGRVSCKLWFGFQIIKSIIQQIIASNYWSFIMLKSHLKIVLRNIKRNKGEVFLP